MLQNLRKKGSSFDASYRVHFFRREVVLDHDGLGRIDRGTGKGLAVVKTDIDQLKRRRFPSSWSRPHDPYTKAKSILKVTLEGLTTLRPHGVGETLARKKQALLDEDDNESQVRTVENHKRGSQRVSKEDGATVDDDDEVLAATRART